MTGTMLISIFLFLYLLNFFIDVGLSKLNILHLQKFTTPPPPFDEYVEAERYQRSVLYTTTYSRFGLISGTINSLLFLFFVYSGLMNKVDQWLYSMVDSETLRGLCFFTTLFLFSYITAIPFSLYSTFAIEEKFGFNRETPRLWIMDQIKSLILSMVMMLPLGYAILWFMNFAGPLWWLFAWLIFFAYNMVLVMIYPVFIAPIFNKFNPLEDGELRSGLEKLAQRAGFPMQNIYVIDASKRSTHSNAYFAGLGKMKRLVLYDSMIQDFSTDEIISVVAHEMGHYHRKHITKMMCVSQLTAFCFFYLLNLAFRHPYLYKTFLITNISTYMGLVLLSFVMSVVMSFFSPLSNQMSWKFETEADRYSYDMIENKNAIKTMLIKLAEKNLSNLTPHPWYARFNYSHPPILNRLKNLGLADSKDS